MKNMTVGTCNDICCHKCKRRFTVETIYGGVVCPHCAALEIARLEEEIARLTKETNYNANIVVKLGAALGFTSDGNNIFEHVNDVMQQITELKKKLDAEYIESANLRQKIDEANALLARKENHGGDDRFVRLFMRVDRAMCAIRELAKIMGNTTNVNTERIVADTLKQ